MNFPKLNSLHLHLVSTDHNPCVHVLRVSCTNTCLACSHELIYHIYHVCIYMYGFLALDTGWTRFSSAYVPGYLHVYMHELLFLNAQKDTCPPALFSTPSNDLFSFHFIASLKLAFKYFMLCDVTCTCFLHL